MLVWWFRLATVTAEALDDERHHGAAAMVRIFWLYGISDPPGASINQIDHALVADLAHACHASSSTPLLSGSRFRGGLIAFPERLRRGPPGEGAHLARARGMPVVYAKGRCWNDRGPQDKACDNCEMFMSDSMPGETLGPGRLGRSHKFLHKKYPCNRAQQEPAGTTLVPVPAPRAPRPRAPNARNHRGQVGSSERHLATFTSIMAPPTRERTPRQNWPAGGWPARQNTNGGGAIARPYFTRRVK